MESISPIEKQQLDKALVKIRLEPEKRFEVFLSLPQKLQAAVLLRLTKHVLFDLLLKVDDVELAGIIGSLGADEATDVLQDIPLQTRQKIITLLPEELKQAVNSLINFDPATAAGLMNIDYILVSESETIAEISRRFKVFEKRTGRLPSIMVQSAGKLIGYVPGHELGFAKPSEVAKKYIRNIFSINGGASKGEVIELFETNPHNKIAVVGEADNLIGIIYSDDVMRIMEEERTAFLYEFAGVSEEESVADSAKTKVLSRYKWLIINLATAFLAALTVGLFQNTISKYVLLAVYMPIVAGMGGNAATQTLAVLVRGISLKQIEFKTALPVLLRELGASLVNGAINGIIIAAIVIFFNGDVKLAIILGIAMVVNLLVAGFFGTIIPLLMKKFGKDPATSATIFITTATDVLGFLVFLGLATMFLR